MKKTIITIAVLAVISTAIMAGNVDSIDSAKVQQVVQQGLAAAEAAKGGADLIPDVPNTVTAATATGLVAILVRFFEKTFMKKKYAAKVAAEKAAK